MPPENSIFERKSGHLVLIITLVTIVVLVALAIAYVAINNGVPPSEPVPVHRASSAQTGSESLGADLYQKSQDPVSDKLPDTPSASANPISDAYLNPF